MRENIIKDKSYQFALKSIKIYKEIIFEKKEYVLSKQFLRSATSIGANVEEGVGGQSKRDFIAKFQISYKEAKETHYWLRLMRDSEIITVEKANILICDVEEIIRILSAILKKSKADA